MARRFKIETSQFYNERGRLGVWLFLGAPLAQGVGLFWLLNEVNSRYSLDRANIGGPSALLAVASFAFLIGCVLIVVGRSQRHDVTEIEVMTARDPARPVYADVPSR